MTREALASSQSSAVPLEAQGLKERQLELRRRKAWGQGAEELRGVAADMGQGLGAVERRPRIHAENEGRPGKGPEEVHGLHYRG